MQEGGVSFRPPAQVYSRRGAGRHVECSRHRAGRDPKAVAPEYGKPLDGLCGRLGEGYEKRGGLLAKELDVVAALRQILQIVASVLGAGHETPHSKGRKLGESAGVEGIERPVGRYVLDAGSLQERKGRQVAGLPLGETFADKALYEDAQLVEGRLGRVDGERKAHESAVDLRQLGVLGRNGNDDLVPFAGRQLLSRAYLYGAARLCGREVHLGHIGFGGCDLRPSRGVAGLVQPLHEIAAQVVQEAHRGKAAVRIDEGQASKRIVRLAKLGERLLDGGAGLIGILRGRELARYGALHLAAAEFRAGDDGRGGKLDGDIDLACAGIVARPEARHGEAALYGVGHRAVDCRAGAKNLAPIDLIAFWDENLDIGSRRDLEDVCAGDGLAHFADAKAEGLAAVGRRELESVMLLKRTRRMEAQPAASVAILGYALDGADRRAEMSERNGVYHVGGRSVQVKLRRAAGEHGLKIGDGGGVAVAAAVQYGAVVGGYARHVERGFHAPLYLEGNDSGVYQAAHILAKAQVLHGEGQRLASRLVCIRQAAAICAPAAISAAVLLHGGKQAESGDGIAERTVDEALQLKVAATLCYGRNLGEGKLARQDDAGEAELLEGEHAFEVVRDELGRGVQDERRKVAAA